MYVCMKCTCVIVCTKIVQMVYLYLLDCFFQMLTNAEKTLHRSQSFQGGFREVYKEENPLAGILTTAYGVRIT